MADQGKSKTRKKKKNEESTADILAGLAKTLDQNTKKAKKKATFMEFRRDPITGRRIYVSNYRPNRKTRAGKFLLSAFSDVVVSCFRDSPLY